MISYSNERSAKEAYLAISSLISYSDNSKSGREAFIEISLLSYIKIIRKVIGRLGWSSPYCFLIQMMRKVSRRLAW